MRHLNSLFDLTPDELSTILQQALELKRLLADGKRPQLFERRMLSMIFEKPSLRTRVSFETAACQLGGAGLFMTAAEAGLHGRESLPDIARVLTRYVDVVALRTFSQNLIEEFAQHAACPVINALSDDRHPCQALTDLMTIQETFGSLNGRHLVYVGDGNNVAASLAIATAMSGMPMTIACPEGYQLQESFLDELRARYPQASIRQMTDPERAVEDADIVYTDVWASMGQESESRTRQQVFADYQVNAALMSRAPKQCRFMHDLPARRGMEVTDEVIEGPQSIVFEQAENRMHLAKGLLAWMTEGR